MNDFKDLLGELIGRGFDRADDFTKLSPVEVLIVGAAGVGKSTLVNTVFHGEIAKTGQGRPVTKEIRRFRREDIPVAITDTPGLEIGKPGQVDKLVQYVRERRERPDARQHIHIAWICVGEGRRRVEPAETELVLRLAEETGVPILGVITQADADNGFRDEVVKLLPHARNVVRVMALPLRKDNGQTSPAHGLGNLAAATGELIPEAMQLSFAAAQRVDLEQKRQAASKVVKAAATAAGASGAIPVPGVDAAVVPILVGMLVAISRIFGVAASQAFLKSLLVSLGATAGGRMVIAGVLKLFPGIGSILGAALGATTAALLTTVLGNSYITVLARWYEKGGTETLAAMSADDFARELKENMIEQKGTQ